MLCSFELRPLENSFQGHWKYFKDFSRMLLFKCLETSVEIFFFKVKLVTILTQRFSKGVALFYKTIKW